MIACRQWLDARNALESSEVLARLRPDTRAHGSGKTRHCEPHGLDATCSKRCTEVIAALHGIEAVREMGHEAHPGFKLAGTILATWDSSRRSRRSSPRPAGPVQSLERVSIRASMRGVTTEYRPTNASSGVVVAHYARPLPPMVLRSVGRRPFATRSTCAAMQGTS